MLGSSNCVGVVVEVLGSSAAGGSDYLPSACFSQYPCHHCTGTTASRPNQPTNQTSKQPGVSRRKVKLKLEFSLSLAQNMVFED